jgi:hypothetical protein
MSAPSRTTNGGNSGRSAYPVPVDELTEAARRLVSDGGLPSQRKLMNELHIGKPKARAVLDALRSEEPSPVNAVRLHLVEPTSTAAPMPVSDAAPESPVSDGEATDSDESDAVAPTMPDEAGPDAPMDGDSVVAVTSEPVNQVADPGTAPESTEETDASGTVNDAKHVPVWPVLLLTLPAFAAVWSGWVSLGGMAGFGVVHPLPGIADQVTLNTAITLPIGVEVYAAYALWVWLSGGVPEPARRFARASAVASLCTGALGQIAYHLLAAARVQHAPWPITTLVACLPVAVLGMGAALAHLVRSK